MYSYLGESLIDCNAADVFVLDDKPCQAAVKELNPRDWLGSSEDSILSWRFESRRSLKGEPGSFGLGDGDVFDFGCHVG